MALRVFYDLESTGFSTARDRIVQIGACVDGEAPGFSALVNPDGVLVHPSAQRVHGLSDAVLAEAPVFAEVWAAFVVFVRKAAGPLQRVLLVGHNSWGFDDRLLTAELARHQLALPFDTETADTLRTVRTLRFPGPCKLAALVAHCVGVPHVGAHTALADAEAVRTVVQRWPDGPLALLTRPWGTPTPVRATKRKECTSSSPGQVWTVS